MNSIGDIPEAICPFCGKCGRGYYENNQIYYVCDNCGYIGPKVYAESILSFTSRISAKKMFENKGD